MTPLVDPELDGLRHLLMERQDALSRARCPETRRKLQWSIESLARSIRRYEAQDAAKGMVA